MDRTSAGGKEGLYRSLVETGPEALFVLDEAGRLRYGNPGLAALLDRPVEQLRGLRLQDWVAPADVPELERALRRATGGEPGPFSVRLRTREEDERRVEGSLTPLCDSAGLRIGIRGFLASESPSPLQLELEAQLRQAQKLESVGRLAGGIAHDFNNMLAVINGYSELLLEQIDRSHPSYSALDQIRRAGERAAALTRQLLTFSRKSLLTPRVLDLSEVVETTHPMLRRVIGADIELVTLAEPEVGRVRADAGQVEQVLLNLVVNARDAMPAGGTLVIRTENVYLDGEYTRRFPDVRPGPYVSLCVEDTGAGIDPEHLPQIFEPFFTTKESGKGTGLGLATIHGFVLQSGGHIDVESELGRGTTFRIYLPRVEDAETAAETAPTPHLPEGSETVLLVEDETMVRSLARQSLQACGYRVLEAMQGEEALEIAARSAGTLDLLLTDVVMPRMNGRELAERLLACHPEVRVLFMSGYTDGAPVEGLPSAYLAGFLQKPFSPSTLARKVREVLDAAPAE